MSQFGTFVKKRRLALNQPFTEFCSRHNADPRWLSLLERGRIPPPAGEPLSELARLLELEDGSTEWHEFFELARKDSGIKFQPATDEEIVAKLPVLFHTKSDAPDNAGDDTEGLLQELKESLKAAL